MFSCHQKKVLRELRDFWTSIQLSTGKVCRRELGHMKPMLIFRCPLNGLNRTDDFTTYKVLRHHKPIINDVIHHGTKASLDLSVSVLILLSCVRRWVELGVYYGHVNKSNNLSCGTRFGLLESKKKSHHPKRIIRLQQDLYRNRKWAEF